MRNIFLLLLLSLSHYTMGQSGGVDLLNELNKNTVSINSFGDDDTTEMKALAPLLKNKQIIGLGEGTHGTKEFYLYKAKLIRYLITHQHLKRLIFESDRCGLEVINDYVMGKDITVGQSIDQSGLFGIYRTTEVRDLLVWIKSYNDTQPQGNKVIVEGMDMRVPYFTVSKLLADKSFTAKLSEQTLADLESMRMISEAPHMGIYKKRYLLSAIKALYKAAEGSKEITTGDVRLLEQSLSLIDLPSIKLNATRDRFMAENVIAISESMKEGEQAVIWAHNGHVIADKWVDWKPAGMHLRDHFKSKYYALCLDFADGTARLHNLPQKPFHDAPLPKVADPESIEFVLKQCTLSNFFLDLQPKFLPPVVKSYFFKPKLIRVLGPMVVPDERSMLLRINVGKGYDGLIFFRETHAASGL